jgi:t-SNARE complex subunit (syntaxin)
MSGQKMSTYDLKDGDKFDPDLFKSVDVSIIRERNKALKEIHEDIMSLQDSFTDLSGMIASQGTDIDLSEDKIDFGKKSVELAHQELEKAEKYTARRRKILGTLAGTGVAIGAALLAVTYWFKEE